MGTSEFQQPGTQVHRRYVGRAASAQAVHPILSHVVHPIPSHAHSTFVGRTGWLRGSFAIRPRCCAPHAPATFLNAGSRRRLLLSSPHPVVVVHGFPFALTHASVNRTRHTQCTRNIAHLPGLDVRLVPPQHPHHQSPLAADAAPRHATKPRPLLSRRMLDLPSLRLQTTASPVGPLLYSLVAKLLSCRSLCPYLLVGKLEIEISRYLQLPT